MKEEFYENSAAPHNEKSQKIIYTVYNVFFVLSVIVLCVAIYMFFMFGDSGFIVMAVFSLLFGTLTFFIKRRLLPYYDYTYISGEVRIIKVINGKHRKKVLFFDCKDVYLLGKTDSESFQKLYATPGIKKIIAAPDKFNTDKQLFYVGVKTGGENYIAVMQCEEKFIAFVAAIAGKNAVEKDYK